MLTGRAQLALGFLAVAASQPGLAADAPAAAPGPARAVAPVGERAFDIWEFSVDGNSLLDDADIQAVLEPFLGPGRRASDVDAARTTLEKLYHQLGYRTVAVSIAPRQTVNDGVIQLNVVEGRVARLSVLGTEYTSLEQIKSEVPSLAEGQVPDFGQVQKDLVYANRFQTRRVTPSLQPGAAPGTVNIDLNVEDRLPLRVFTELNNRFSKGTTERRALVGLGYDNLFQRGHSLTLTFQTAPERMDDGRVYLANYLMRFGDGSWSLQASGLRTTSNVTAFSGIGVVGSGSSVGLKLIRQLPDVDGKLYPSVSLGADYKHFNTVTTVAPAEIRTPSRYLPLSLSYSQFLRLEQQRVQTDVTLAFASTKVGSDNETLDLNRYGARGGMWYLRGSINYSLDLFAGFELALKLAGQVTDQPLISSEQFSAGGMDSVRGYLEAEALGDNGGLAALELQAPSIPDLFASRRWASYLSELRPFLFFDTASVSLRGPFPDAGTRRSSTLRSSGAGISMRVGDNLSLFFDWSQPLREGPYTPKGDGRLLFRVSASL